MATETNIFHTQPLCFNPCTHLNHIKVSQTPEGNVQSYEISPQYGDVLNDYFAQK